MVRPFRRGLYPRRREAETPLEWVSRPPGNCGRCVILLLPLCPWFARWSGVPTGSRAHLDLRRRSRRDSRARLIRRAPRIRRRVLPRRHRRLRRPRQPPATNRRPSPLPARAVGASLRANRLPARMRNLSRQRQGCRPNRNRHPRANRSHRSQEHSRALADQPPPTRRPLQRLLRRNPIRRARRRWISPPWSNG
jgi:hypothetical protein